MGKVGWKEAQKQKQRLRVLRRAVPWPWVLTGTVAAARREPASTHQVVATPWCSSKATNPPRVFSCPGMYRGHTFHALALSAEVKAFTS